jgi:2-hydroxycyclohexanecarboxyl-CoA dehydrogenase
MPAHFALADGDSCKDRADVSQRIALVTGGAGGIGSAIARELAEGGCRVAVCDLRADAAEAIARQVGGLGVELDVTSPASVAEAVSLIESSLGAVDVAVNSAGWDELRPFLDTDESFWAKVMEINFTGGLRVTRAVLPGMMERGWGRIVNVASDAGRVGSSSEAVYSGAKGGVIAFTKTVARETARRGVTANSVCPGPTRTPLLESMTAEGGERLIEALTRAVPMRRLAEPDDVSAAVAFFASERAGFITGQTLSVSGGMTMA